MTLPSNLINRFILFMLVCFLPNFIHAKSKLNTDSLELALVNQSDSVKVLTLNKMSIYFLDQQNTQKSLKKGLRALDIANKIENDYLRLITISNLMDSYSALFLYDDALKLGAEAEKLSSQLKRIDFKAKIYFKKANIYRNLREFEKAENNFKLALVSTGNNSTKEIVNLKAEIMLGLAACQRNLNRFNEAMKTNKSGLAIAETIQSDTLLSFFYNNIGDLYEIAGKLDTAYTYYQTSMRYNLKNNDIEGLYFNYSNLASIEKFRGNYDKAIELLEKSVELAKKNHAFNFLYNDYLHLFGVYSAKRDHKTALEYLILLEQSSAPQNDSDTSLYVAKVESKFELDKKDIEKEILNLKMGQQRSSYLLIIMVVLLVLFVATAVYYLKYKQKKIAELVLKEGKARAELDALQARINPHFLFNSLNSLGSLISRNPKNADTMLNNLSRLLRYTLQTAKKDLVTIEEEISTVKNYLLIEKIRFEDRLDFSINCETKLHNYLIPPLIIQPLVENAIKYAVGRMIAGGKIVITCSIEGKLLKIKVEDNGPPLDKPLPNSKSTGFGMKYIKERLSIMYGTNCSFEIDKSNGYSVTIIIPAETIRSN